VGSEVVVDGLSKLPVFNGKSGIVQSFDTKTERYAVLLDTPVAVGNSVHRLAKVRIENLHLRVVAPPPSRHVAPTLLSRQSLLATGPRPGCAGTTDGGFAQANADPR